MISTKLRHLKDSKVMVLIIVGIGLFLDNMLLTTITPIIPLFIHQQSIQFQQNLSSSSYGLIDWNATTLENSSENPDMSTIHIHEHQPLADSSSDNLLIGLLFSSKALMQLIANPFIGILTLKVGYHIPMFIGFITMFISSLVFAFGESYLVLFSARAAQGIGSSGTAVAGLGLLASKYTDDEERGRAMGLALGGIALGVLAGPPFGGIVYEFFDKSTPFLVLGILCLLDGMLQLLLFYPFHGEVTNNDDDKSPSLWTLLRDPYIMIAAGAITFSNAGMAMLEPSLPVYMIETMTPTKLELGIVFLPGSIGYLLGTNLLSRFIEKMERWLKSLLGFVGIAISLLCVPLASNIYHLIGPLAVLGLTIGIVDCSIIPHLAQLVDLRYQAEYGTVYAIGDTAICLGFFAGPALSGILVNAIGFQWTMVAIAIVTGLYAPLLLVLANCREKEAVILNKQSQITKF